MKYGSVCSGIEAASVAWESLGWQAQWYSEIEHFPSAVLAHRFPAVPNLGDMTQIHNSEHFNGNSIDLLVGGTPCFALGTPIVTSRGIIPIEDVVVGDMVLTHKLRWKPVLAIGSKEAETVKLAGHGHSGIETTPEHPFYSRVKNQTWNNSKRMYERHLSQNAEWVDAKDMVGKFWGIPTKGDSLPIPPISLSGNETHLPIINQSFYWIVGAWLGDGWTRISKRRSYVLICADKNNHELIARHLDNCGLKYSLTEERTTMRYQVASSALAKWLVENFNKGAKNKTLASWVLFGLDEESKRSLFDGYRFADGYKIYDSKKNHNGFGATTISKCLATGIRLLGASLGYSVGENYCKPNRKVTTIEGRKVNEQPFYQIRFHSNSRSAIEENGILWQKTKKYKQTNAIRTVSNLEVADDNSYVAGGIIVHNCQSFSVAGLRKGLDDTRGQLMLTFCELAARKRPRWVVWENVPGVLSSNKGEDLASFLGLLTGREIHPPVGGWKNSGVVEGIGSAYGVAWTVLDAQYFGVAQRRRRIFAIGYLGDWRPAAAVLFESYRLSGDIKEGRKKRKTTSEDAQGGVGGGGIPRVSGSLDTECGGGKLTHQSINNGHLIPDVSKCVISRQGQAYDPETETMIPSWWNGEQTAATLTKQNANGAQRMPDKDNFGAVLEPVAHAFKVRGGSETETGEQGGTPGKKAGKGYLGSDELAFTIGTTQDQQIAQPIAYSFDSLASNSMKSSNPNSGCREVETSKTLDTSNPDPSKNQGGIAIAQPIALAENTIGRQPLNGGNGDGFTEKGPMYTLNATGVHGVAQPIAYENHPSDSRVKEMGDTCSTVTSKYGTGGGNTPLVAQPIPFRKAKRAQSKDDHETWEQDEKTNTLNAFDTGDIRTTQAVVQPIAVDTYNYTTNERTTQTIRSQNDTEHIGAVLTPPTIIDRAAFNQGQNAQYDIKIEEGQTMSSLVAKGPHGVATQNLAPALTASNNPSRSPQSSEVTQQIAAVHRATMAIRRLTPRECERLQGFPDDWTLIPYRNKSVEQCPDGPRYKACGNSMAVPVMAWIGKRIQMVEDIINNKAI